MAESLRGQLLVAAPDLLEPTFRRTVVLVTEHTAQGAMGVVLNRPTDASVGEVAPDLTVLVDPDEPVHAGGPVQPSSVVVLARFAEPEHAALLVLDDVGFVPAAGDLEELAGATRLARVYAGHAGWAGGQLDAEVAADGWILAPATPDDVFTDDPDGLWSAVLRRLGGRFALVARMPLDPSVN